MSLKISAIVFLFILAIFVSSCRFDSMPPGNSGGGNNNAAISKETPTTKNSAAGIKVSVVHISDGDTFIIEDESGKRTTVRIHAIDAPELSQTFGKESRENLRALIANQQVEIHKYDTDQYHRVVGSIFLNGKDIGLEQIRGGYAWHFKQYQKEQTAEERQAYAEAENMAKSDRLGLWRDGNVQAPQDYRRTHENPYTKQK